MWFLVAARHQSSDEIIADVPVQITAPDGEVINSYLDTYVRGPSVRLTWQAAPEAQACLLRPALVEAQGQGLRRRAGSARVAVPRSEACASHGRQRQVDVAADQQAPVRRRLFVDAVRLARRPDARRRAGARHAGVVREDAKDRHAAAGHPRVRVHGGEQARRLHDLGIESDSAAGQHAPRVSGGRVVRHRLAQHQVRLQPRDRPRRPHGQRAQRRSLSELHGRGAELGRRVEHAARSAGYRRLRRRVVSAGHVDDQAAHDQSGLAHRMVQRGHASGARPTPAGSCLRGSSQRSAVC